MNNETSIKKFVYLMINDIERQNNIRESIESTRTYVEIVSMITQSKKLRADMYVIVI